MRIVAYAAMLAVAHGSTPFGPAAAVGFNGGRLDQHDQNGGGMFDPSQAPPRAPGGRFYFEGGISASQPARGGGICSCASRIDPNTGRIGGPV